MDFWLQLLVMLACLFYGARKGGMALGLLGGIGLVILIFGFGLKPGKPPTDVILTILAVVCGSATLQAAGGLDCLLQIAEKILRKNPKYVCFLAPYVCWFLTVLCGTGHVVYTMLPIIYDVAIKNGVRPERPMAGSTIASQMGVICSPAAVAAVSMIALMDGYTVGGHSFGFVDLFSVTIPGGIIGVFAVGCFSMVRGKDLDKDPEFQALIADPETKRYVYGDSLTLIGKKFSKEQWLSLYIFLGVIVIVALLGMFPELRPMVGKKRLSMTLAIQMFMLMGGSFMCIFCGVKAADVAKN
ncbi:MAG: anaerobic C4-dicarboxylate transporter, partial [Burkholderiaceae bacterium]|nr:anaerobic C4-dicarboxylate transporter [Burkholderiaceae bacterium]